MGMSAAGYHLAKQGVKTRLVHAFDLPHTQGSHHGETRLIRHAYSGDPAFIDMALRAHVLWKGASRQNIGPFSLSRIDLSPEQPQSGFTMEGI